MLEIKSDKWLVGVTPVAATALATDCSAALPKSLDSASFMNCSAMHDLAVSEEPSAWYMLAESPKAVVLPGNVPLASMGV